jgi:hypothetical protein
MLVVESRCVALSGGAWALLGDLICGALDGGKLTVRSVIAADRRRSLLARLGNRARARGSCPTHARNTLLSLTFGE